MTITTSENSHGSGDTGLQFKYCPKCAGQLEDRHIEQRMRQACAACDFVLYRDPKPVAGVLAQRDEKILLIQRGNQPKHGFWSFPSGFIDIGDTAAETAIREAKEEANVEVQLDRLLGVYSNAHRTVVLIIYVGHLVSGVPMGSAEALDARLFNPQSIPQLAFDHDYRILADLFDIGNRMRNELPIQL